jgi:acyl-CoA thioester hydrolase
MDIIHTCDYRVRFYECDAIGHLNNAVYVKYMHDAANEASRAVGLDREDYLIINRSWLVRETKIEYLAPLQYGDSLKITTWVEDMHRVRSLRIYEFSNVNSGELVARAETDWVFVNTDTGLPTKIPPDIKKAYIGTDSSPERKIGRRFPKTPPEAKEVFRVLRSVEWRDLDPLGHVNNAVYLSYIEDCGMKVAQAYGWPWQRMSEHNFAIVARMHHIEYRQPAFMDEILEISTWVSSIRRSTGTRHYVIRRQADKSVIAVCHSLYVWVDLETLKPIRIPDNFLNAFLNNISVAPVGGV